MWLLAIFSGVALTPAVTGLFGVISYSVGQRTSEIGIRMALGARREQVLRQVVRQGMLLVAAGVIVGLLASLATARVVSGILVGVSATDPVVYVGVTLLLVAVAALANFVPARRAARLEPMEALRKDYGRGDRISGPRARVGASETRQRPPLRSYIQQKRVSSGRVRWTEDSF